MSKSLSLKYFRDGRGTALKSLRMPFVCGLLFIVLLKYVFFIGYVPSASMEPAISEGSFIFAVRSFGVLNRGDVIVFEHGSRLNVKRIAALPGESVTVMNKALTVPAGCYYMLGDNAEDSIDSRYWTDPFLRASAVIAKVWID